MTLITPWKAFALILVLLTCFTNSSQPASDLHVQTIRTAYRELGDRVTQALRVQAGDLSQINRQQASAHEFLSSVTQVCMESPTYQLPSNSSFNSMKIYLNQRNILLLILVFGPCL